MQATPPTLVILLCLSACHHDPSHHEHEADHSSHGSEAQASHGAEGGSHGSELQLTLDDGKKWPVDDPTRASAARLAKLAGEAPNLESRDDARALGEALDRELDVLVKGCTMTGPAHDQLHAFLTAFIPQVEKLKHETAVDELRRVKGEVDSLLEAYERHFETAAGDA